MTALDVIHKYLINDPDAQIWCISYCIHCHAIDDIVDGDKTNFEHIIKTFQFTIALCSSPFYRRNATILEPLMHASANSYADSVAFERSNESWKKHYGDVLRQAGNDVILACINLVAGPDARREASLMLREISYRDHHDKLGNPI